MATTREIRAALEVALKDVFGTSLQLSKYALGNPTPPTLQLKRGAVTPHETLGVSACRQIIVQAIAGMVSDIGAQMLLEEFAEPTGPRSVLAAIEANSTLGGLVDDLVVSEISDDRVYTTERGSFWGCEFTVDVFTSS